jgi:cellulose synthase operon protein C
VSVYRPIARGAAALAVVSSFTVPAAHAALPDPTGPSIQPSLQRAVDELARARGPDKYAALRAVWSQWDQTDPSFVQEAIGQVERDEAESPPIRAYASVIDAYARRRRGDLDGARAKLAAVGSVSKWLSVGPFDNEGRAGFAQTYGPEQDLSDPISLTRSYPGKERPVHWRPVPDVYAYGWLDLGDLIRPKEKACVFASTFVKSKPGFAAPRAISVWVGAAGAFKLFWNGAEVLADPAYRGLDADRLAAGVTLANGWNRLTVKVCGDDDGPMVSVRLGDARGAPDPGITVSSDMTVADQAAANFRAAKPRAKSRIEGPLQTFTRLVSAPNARPAILEAFARYLRLTGGDDPASHQAQDLARRAANAELTWQRALIASALAEDRNEKRDWLERADDTAGKNKPVDLLLARAELARSGPSWRDAVPYYDKVLAIEPNNARALLGRVELYREAGLKRTAVLTLENALEDNPRSVGLLRVYASSLRELGRIAEADEAADRYSAFRFDDSTYLSDRIDVAVMRRDTKAAARWIDRLLAADPDSSWALSVAARAYRAMGQRGRAIASYQKALDLAPEDTEAMRAQADLYGERGDRDEQRRFLRQILTVRPQAKDIREYIEHIEPPKPRADEQHAWAPERFLPRRSAPAAGEIRRTLRDLTVTTVYANGLASHFRQVVFQPLTDEAAASAREYTFVYQADSEVVQLRAAKVYRANGKVDEAIESGEGPADNPALAMYTSAHTFYVHFPRLNSGDVVELRYRVEDVAPRNELADYFGEVVYLQKPEPTAEAEYVLRTPKSRSFRFKISELRGLSARETADGETREYVFNVEKPAPVLPEPSMPPFSEVLGHVHVSTYRTWDQVAAWYWGLAKDQLVADDEMRRRVATITKGLAGPLDKVRAIYGEVVQRTRYVALEFGIYGYKPRPAAQTFARGWGDCKDKAALMVTMLKEAGIAASLVLVRSGIRGEIEPDPPSLAPFDHAIAYVPSLQLFLDGTAEYTGSMELPPLDRGALALVVDSGGKGTLLHLPDPDAQATRRSRKIDATPTPEGGAQIDLRTEVSGALAAEARQRYHAKGTRRERVGRDLAADFHGFELAAGQQAVEMNDLEDIEQPVRLRARGKAAGFARREGADLSIAVGPSDRLVARFASLSSRKQDIRLFIRSSFEEEIVVHLPAGYRVKAAPDPLSAEGPFGRFAISAEVSPGKVVVKTKLAFDKSRISAGEYPAWRAFCEATDRALSQRLVLGVTK